MSIKINIDTLSLENRQKINDDLKIEMKGSGINKYIFPYNILSDDIFIPFYFANQKLKLKRPIRDNYSSMNVRFEGVLREEQLEVKKEAIDILSKQGSIILSMYTGFGKTIESINIACSIKLKTIIIVNKIVLLKQWEESILKFCPTSKVLKLTPQTKFNPDYDFYIINATNVSKFGYKTFKDIGLVLVDEAHLILAEGLSKSLLCLLPRYLIGLSATPYRQDGLDGLFEFFFGEYKIVRNLFRKHIVYKVETDLEILMELSENTGKVNWGAVLKKQSENEERNELIIKIIQKFNERNILVLCKRVEQSTYIFKRLKELGESVTSLIGSQQDFDKEARVLVATNSKAGTGFDHQKLDALLLACDLDSYYIQALGRIFRTKDTIPVVFDLVDDNPILIRHYKNRKEVYTECGGKIINFNDKFPELSL